MRSERKKTFERWRGIDPSIGVEAELRVTRNEEEKPKARRPRKEFEKATIEAVTNELER